MRSPDGGAQANSTGSMRVVGHGTLFCSARMVVLFRCGINTKSSDCEIADRSVAECAWSGTAGGTGCASRDRGVCLFCSESGELTYREAESPPCKTQIAKCCGGHIV